MKTVISLQTFWEDVRAEMIDEKGLDPVAADKIGEFVQMKGGPELIDQLLKDSPLTGSKAALGTRGHEVTPQILQHLWNSRQGVV